MIPIVMGVNKFLPEDKKIKPGKMIGDKFMVVKVKAFGNITLLQQLDL